MCFKLFRLHSNFCCQITQLDLFLGKLEAAVELEASGGVTLETVAPIAQTGVERISVGALTHSAVSLDLGLDWQVSR